MLYGRHTSRRRKRDNKYEFEKKNYTFYLIFRFRCIYFIHHRIIFWKTSNALLFENIHSFDFHDISWLFFFITTHLADEILFWSCSLTIHRCQGHSMNWNCRFCSLLQEEWSFKDVLRRYRSLTGEHLLIAGL